MKALKTTVFLQIICVNLWAQELIPIGTWRSHFNFRSVQKVVEGDEAIYGATRLAILVLDREDNSLSSLSKVNGLSDVGISALGYNRASGHLIVGYENGNLDILKDNEVTNVRSIATAQIIGSKKINHVSDNGQLAYLSTDFGVVVVDLQTGGIVESYRNLGPAGEETSVRQSVILNDSIYLATDFGVISGNISTDTNLQDFQSWNRYSTAFPVDDEAVDFVGVLDQEVVAIVDNELFNLSPSGWAPSFTFSQSPLSLTSTSRGLLIVVGDQLLLLDSSIRIDEINYVDQPSPSDAVIDEDGRLWIADQTLGLIGNNGTGNFENFVRNGPLTDQTFRLYQDGDSIISLPGGFGQNFEPLNGARGYSTFDLGSWTIQPTTELNFANLTDALRIGNSGLFIGSFGSGILEAEAGTIIDNQTPEGPFADMTRGPQVTGVDSDSNGNLWVSEYDRFESFHRRDPNGVWSSFSFNIAASRFPILMEVNQFDDIWAGIDPNEGGGVFVFNAVTDQQRFLNVGEGQGNLPNSHVTDILFDLEGQAWIGTETGVAVIPDPFIIFEDQGFDAIRPIFENRPLLEEEFITSMIVDGGNRKWIGTNNGLWLFSPSGESLIENFNIDNSPLPSNEIVDLEINPSSGELFVATRMGMVSFRGTSTAGTEKHEAVKIFPNPVRPGYTGTVGISGVVRNAIVKITDTGGRLVREVRAQGGTAVWDTRDFSGNVVSSGVYIVFSSSDNGNETFVGKIAIVR